MGNFAYIPITALFCYVFFLLAIIAAKKNKIINSFMLVLAACILWTGGSFCMRAQIMPSVKFWYDVSIFGLLLLTFAFFNFIFEFVGCKKIFLKRFYFSVSVIVAFINMLTGVFLKCPSVVKSKGGEVSFIYSPTWTVAILFSICAVYVVHMFYLLFKNSKKSEAARKQVVPIILGMLIIFIGHLCILIPLFKGFPTDIAAGVINAAFMFYALYKRRLFKLTLLVSRGSCYAISIGLSVVIFAYLAKPIERFITKYISSFADYAILIIAVFFSLAIFLINYIMKKFIDNVFIKDVIAQAENLKKFSHAVSKSLHIDEILEELVDVIQNTISVRKVYICIIDNSGSYFSIAHSTSPLDKKSFSIKKDNPVVGWLQENGECLLMREFKRTVAYKSMWEEEKRQFNDLGVECFVPLKDENDLVGIVLLSGKEKSSFSYDDLSFLSSVDYIGSIAVKNSRLYEKAYLEARTDELTGLLNRKYFYEILQKEYETNKNNSLALIILNIDDFKLYNQLYGNKEGDIALQNISHIIRASVGSNGFIARISGKEFAVILPMYDTYAAKNLAESIRKQVLNMNKRSTDYSLKVLTLSGGICSIPYAASSVKQLINNADMAVYHAKRKGKNLIIAYSVNEEVKSEEVPSEKKVDIYSEYASTIYALTAAIDAKDHYTFNHSKNVTYYATKLAKAYGMSEEYVEIVREAALLHDIGKIGIPERILNKPGKLTPEEYEIMKTHVENSIGIIRHLPSLDYVIPAVIGHHERYDGNGYPRKIGGEDIPVSARILCIADSFDAMVSKRSYKDAYSVEYALRVVDEQAGLQFDPKLAKIFIDLVSSGYIKVTDETLEMHFEIPERIDTYKN